MSIGGRDLKLNGAGGIFLNFFYVLWFVLFFNFFVFGELGTSFWTLALAGFNYFTIFIGLILIVAIFAIGPRVVKSFYYMVTQKPIATLTLQGVEFYYPVKGTVAWDNIEHVAMTGLIPFYGYLVLTTKTPTELAKKVRRRNFWMGSSSLFRKNSNTKIQILTMDFGAKKSDIISAFSEYSNLTGAFKFLDI